MLIPQWRGTIDHHGWREELWVKLNMAAPQRGADGYGVLPPQAAAARPLPVRTASLDPAPDTVDASSTPAITAVVQRFCLALRHTRMSHAPRQKTQLDNDPSSEGERGGICAEGLRDDRNAGSI